MTSKCCKSKNVAREPQVSVSVMFLHIVMSSACDPVNEQWHGNMELFVLYNKETKKLPIMRSSKLLSSNRSCL